MIHEFKFNKNDYKKITKYKTRKIINLKVCNKSLKSCKQDKTKKSSYENTNL